MLKVLIILILVVYIFYKVSSFAFNFLFGGFKDGLGQKEHSHSNPRGSIHINDYPEPKKRKKRDFDGGEYVDFEEVK
jgi:hypothetical protein